MDSGGIGFAHAPSMLQDKHTGKHLSVQVQGYDNDQTAKRVHAYKRRVRHLVTGKRLEVGSIQIHEQSKSVPKS